MTDVAEVSVTIKRKESARYAGDSSWLVFRGTVRGVKKALADAFGLSEDLALPTLMNQAERIHQSHDSAALPTLTPTLTPTKAPEPAGQAVVEEVLGGEVISDTATDEDDPWAAVSPETIAEVAALYKDELLDAIQSAESRSALRNLHAANVELFKQDKYKDALRARAKEVS